MTQQLRPKQLRPNLPPKSDYTNYGEAGPTIKIYGHIVETYDFSYTYKIKLRSHSSQNIAVTIPQHAYSTAEQCFMGRILGDYGPSREDTMLVVMPAYIQDESNYLKIREKDLIIAATPFNEVNNVTPHASQSSVPTVDRTRPTNMAPRW